MKFKILIFALGMIFAITDLQANDGSGAQNHEQQYQLNAENYDMFNGIHQGLFVQIQRDNIPIPAENVIAANINIAAQPENATAKPGAKFTNLLPSLASWAGPGKCQNGMNFSAEQVLCSRYQNLKPAQGNNWFNITDRSGGTNVGKFMFLKNQNWHSICSVMQSHGN